MKFAAVVFACVLAIASAQYNTGRYNPGQYNNRYDPFNFYKKTPYPRYQYTTPAPYRPFVTTAAPAPVPVVVPVPVAPVPVVPVSPVARVVADARDASIVKYGNELNPDGSYNYFYETNNGIAAQEQGVPRTLGGNPPVSPVVAQGSFTWTSPEGEVVAINYVADENGYQPSGSAIPVPPAVPAQIARALEYTAKYHAVKK